MPAGELTFKAPVGRLNRLDHRDMYPPEFAVTQRYKGVGQVAGAGFSNKKCATFEAPGQALGFAAGYKRKGCMVRPAYLLVLHTSINI